MKSIFEVINQIHWSCTYIRAGFKTPHFLSKTYFPLVKTIKSFFLNCWINIKSYVTLDIQFVCATFYRYFCEINLILYQFNKTCFPNRIRCKIWGENSNDNFSFHKPKITVDDFILFSTYSAIFYQYVEFNYGNKDRSPLENVKFYRNDKSAKLTDDEVSILGT